MGKKLFIISGHGAGDTGAIGNGCIESERVRTLAAKIKEYGGDNVILADFNINSYKSNIIGKGLVPKDSLILELHLDSHKNTNAKGGHIIINGNFKADEYDERLATMISTMFPGRAKTIVGRTDLANVRRAAECGYNYRLMECCFISNADDIAKFNSSLDKLAKEILKCFEISVKETETPKPQPTATIKEGDMVKVNEGAKDYNGKKVASFVYKGTYKVDELKGDRSVLDKNGICTAFNVKDLTLVKSTTVKTETPKPTVNYFPKYSGKSAPFVDALKSLGINSALSYRGKIAKANGIVKNANLYIGLKSHNEKMFALLKQGKLIKP